ncbi:MAG: dihydroorotate dehydrogenase-like protein, partial [Acidimicrobiales bacterium]|nr:dihydroorotate dehydrogenase-like protein [Acidimicrobiales bacterium]
VRRLDEAGAGAIVLPSLFEEEVVEEEIQLNRALEQGADQFAEALEYFPAIPRLDTAFDRYIDHLARAKDLTEAPVIASLNAATGGGWVRYAELLEDAGADALELNLYRVAGDPTEDAATVEERDLALIRSVRDATTLPLAVKLSPYYSSFAHFAAAAVDAGADGLVVFNRFYQPDLDLETLDVVPRLELSSPGELRLPLRWIAMLRPQLGAAVSLAATSGVHSGRDAAKALLVGADVAMTTSALLRQGPGRLDAMLRELLAWLDAHGYESVAQLRGSVSHRNAEDPAAFERANYRRVLRSWNAGAAADGPGLPVG